MAVLSMKSGYLIYYCLFWRKPANGPGPARGKCPQVVTSKNRRLDLDNPYEQSR